MKKSNFKSMSLVAGALAFVSLSSCNRGMGCPTFSIDLTDVVAAAINCLTLLF